MFKCGLAGTGDPIPTRKGTLSLFPRAAEPPPLPSPPSQVGVRLGRGETLAQIGATMKEVAEGVPTSPAAVRLADKLVRQPLRGGP